MVVRDRKPLLLAALGLVATAAAVAIALVLMLRYDEPAPDLTVTADTVVKIDPDTNEIAAVTKSGRGPESIAAGGDAVWVYNWDDRTVSMIDAATSRVTRTRSISGSPPFITGSISIAADKDGAWVLSNAGGTGLLTRVHADDRLPQEHSFSYDPVSIAAGERAVWVGAKNVHGNVVLRIDPLNLPGNEAMQVVVGDGAVWALTFVPAGRKQLIRIDPRTLRMTKTVAAPDVPGAGSSNFTGSVAIGHGAVWWNGAETGTVWRVEPQSGTISATTRFTPPAQKFADPQPYAIAASTDDVWVSVRVPP